MGILDFLSGLGSQGGFLQQMGLGKYGGQTMPGMGQQMGQGSNFSNFLKNAGQAMSQQPQQDQSILRPPPGNDQQQGPGLSALIQQWIQQNQRQ